MREQIKDKGSRSQAQGVHQIYALIALVATVVLCSMGYVYYLGRDMAATHGPLIDGAMEIKLEMTLAHLWLEEMISGDRPADLEQVVAHLDASDRFAQAMLAGGRTDEGVFLPLRNLRLRAEIGQVREKLGQFKDLTLQRWQARLVSGADSPVNQTYNRLFADLLLQVDQVETALQAMIARELRRFRSVQKTLMVVCLAVTVTVGAAFRAGMHRQIRAGDMLRVANQQLDAANQQLQAAEQQLRAHNQQLDASNQQLRATEQQLRAHNQQVRATEQQLRATSEQLRISEQRYHNVYETAPLAFVIWDLECRVTDWNDRAQDVFGWSQEEVLGKVFFDFLIPEGARPQVEDVVRALLNGQVQTNVVNENLTKRGETLLCLWNNSLLRDREGTIVGVISLALDVTAQRRAQASLQELTDKLEQRVQQRTAQLQVANQELEAFAYSVSHDLKAPLRSINGFSKIIMEDHAEALDEVARDHLQRIRAASLHMERLISDLLELSRLTRAEMRFSGFDPPTRRVILRRIKSAPIRIKVNSQTSVGLDIPPLAPNTSHLCPASTDCILFPKFHLQSCDAPSSPGSQERACIWRAKWDNSV